MDPRTDGTTLFVGLGRMGAPMARRYAPLRHLLLHDADPGTTRRLSAETGADGLAELTDAPSDVDTVILMLPTSRVVEDVLLGGLLDRLEPGALVVDMGSSEPSSTRQLAERAASRGLHYVDAPVSGGVAKAVTGELAVMVGGSEESVELALPHLTPFGSSIHRVGPPGAGHAAKALNNLLSATNLAAAAEVLCAAQRAGIRPEVMVDVLNSSTGRSQATEVKYPRHVLTGTFASGFELDLMLKDLRIAAGLAAESGLTTPITSTALETIAEARQHLGAAGLDHTEIARYYEELNDSRLRSDERTEP